MRGRSQKSGVNSEYRIPDTKSRRQESGGKRQKGVELIRNNV